MNSIIGFSELIEDPDLPVEKRHRFVDIITNSTRQLLSIVNNILTISSLDKKQEIITNDSIFLNNLLDDLLIVFNQKALNNKTQLIKTINSALDNSAIITDKTKLTQILTNLISNALKFTPNGIVEFGYTVIGSELEFFVKDSGIGIKKEHQALIFERFRQADLNISKKYGGNGLGLAISKQFVELLGGKIWVESEFGRGATFKFTLPLRKDKQ
jgi:signal transduction histidine kinase